MVFGLIFVVFVS
jgi:hypothetical protein